MGRLVFLAVGIFAGCAGDDAKPGEGPDCPDGPCAGDACPDDPDKDQPGLCGCGVPDGDADGDGVPDCDDGCPDDAGKDQAGICGCGVDEGDLDGDGVVDCVDLCPEVADPGQEDGDADGVGDGCDNCAAIPNADQADADGDGTGDQCACDVAPLPCVAGQAGPFACDNVDLLSFVPLSAFGPASSTNDVWGWADADGREFALIGLDVGLGFVEVTRPYCPVVVGVMPTESYASPWRDVETYADHAYVVADQAGAHGLQVFDLGRLAEAVDAGKLPVVFQPDNVYTQFGSAHTVTIDAEAGILAANGSETCSGGMHLVDLAADPAAPVFLGCYDRAGYVHDAQCFTYAGPDPDHQGSTVCITANAWTGSVDIVDLADPADPVRVSDFTYPEARVAHQGWVTEDHRYLLFGDEYDELFGLNTTTHVFDLRDLDLPVHVGAYDHGTTFVDHQQYVNGGYVYQANYTGGLTVLDLAGVESAALSRVAWFDVVPGSDAPDFAGAWSNYPWLPSGTIPVSSMYDGLFLLDVTLP